MVELGLRCCGVSNSTRWVTFRVEVEAVEHPTIYERLKREEQAKEKDQGGIRLHRRLRVSYEQEDDDADEWDRVAVRQRGKRGETACGPVRWAGPQPEKRAPAGFGPTREDGAAGPRKKSAGRNWAFGPNRERSYFLFPFSFPTLQIHFQMIFEIIFF
jgi:hypothetical protein